MLRIHIMMDGCIKSLEDNSFRNDIEKQKTFQIRLSGFTFNLL